ncbi:MAG: D-Ala-D-Ala carboxypeptidase family metallohydrolase [Bdellovibrionota bacterium]
MDLTNIYQSNSRSSRLLIPGVNYRNHQVSDQKLRDTLAMISYFLGSALTITSGDRRRIVNRNSNSQHLAGRAADFIPDQISLSNAYTQMQNMDFLSTGYQVIYHTEATRSPHLHIGRYLDNRTSSFVVDRGQILPRRRKEN